nr:hypothetical protein [Tanacetum cinerariifolium]
MNESDLNDIHMNESEVLNNVFDSHKSDGDDNQINDRFKKGEGYHVVPPPYTRNYMPPRADLSFAGLNNYVFKSKELEMKYTRLLMLAKQLRKCGKLSKGYNKPEWSRFVTIVKQQHKLDEVSYHKLFEILKQYQKEVNELRAKRLARNANPLALVATAQANQDPYYQTSSDPEQAQRDKDMQKNLALIEKYFKKIYEPTNNNLRTSSNSRNKNIDTSPRYKGKEIDKPITPPSESAFKKDSDPEQAQRDKDMHKNLALIAKYFKRIYKPNNNILITSSNSRNKNVNTTTRYKNDNQSGQFRSQRTINVAGARDNKAKRVKDSAYHKEKMLLCKQAEKGVPLQAEQSDWLADTDEEIDGQEFEAHYSYMAKIQENDQNDVQSDDERVALANLIANLKLNVDENKRFKIN